MSAYLIGLYEDEDYIITNLPEVKLALKSGIAQFDKETDIFYYIENERNKDELENMLNAIKNENEDFYIDRANIVDFYFENEWIVEDDSYINEKQNYIIYGKNIDIVKKFLENEVEKQWESKLDFTKIDFGRWLDKTIKNDVDVSLWKYLVA